MCLTKKQGFIEACYPYGEDNDTYIAATLVNSALPFHYFYAKLDHEYFLIVKKN